MSMIDGVGDEVTEFFLVLTVILIGVGAWWSTATNYRLRIRTVLILEHRINTTSVGGNNTITVSEPRDNSGEHSEAVAAQSTTTPVANGDTVVEDITTSDDIEQSAIVQTMDSGDTGNDEHNVLRKRRLAYFEGNTSNNAENSTTIQDNAENENISNEEQTIPTSSHPSSSGGGGAGGDVITIKLKYLNDDVKTVDGKLLEKLGDFKRRHFEVELAACKLVRLIFNGQVLQKDGETLKACGLFDNCVVHCLIHQQPPGGSHGQQSSSSNIDGTSSTSFRENIFSDNVRPFILGERDINGRRTNLSMPLLGERGGGVGGVGGENPTLPWDLGNVLLALISFILGTAWYFRFEYAQLFTVTATVFLMCLTGIFTLLLIGFLYPDYWNVRTNNNVNGASAPTSTTTASSTQPASTSASSSS